MKIIKIIYWIATISMFGFAYLFLTANWIYMTVLMSSVGLASILNYYEIRDINQEDTTIFGDKEKLRRNRRAEYFNSLSKEEQESLINDKTKILEK